MKQVAAQPYPWPFDGPFTTADTVLLVLGLQQAAVAELGAAAVHALEPVLERWRGRGGFVVWSRRGVADPAELAPPQRWRNERRQRDRILTMDDPGWQLVLPPAPDEPVVDHVGDDAFFGTDLGHILYRRSTRNLLVAGLRTDGIVHATMRSANDQGFECLLVEDAAASDSDALHQGILAITTFGGGLFGTVAPARAVLAALDTP